MMSSFFGHDRGTTGSWPVMAPNSVDTGRGHVHFWLATAFYDDGDEGPGMQSGRTEAPPINPKKLVSSSARTLCKRVPFSPSLPSLIVTVAVRPDTSGTP